jgi:hypothetical protein
MSAKATFETDAGLPEGYVRRAFLLQYNLILLGGAALFSLASASALPLLVGLALELLWLVVATNLAGVRRFLDEPAQDLALGGAEPEPAAPPPRPVLEPLYANRAALFERLLGDIREQTRRVDAATDRHVTASLEAIGRSFAGLCENHQRVSKYLNATPEAAIVEEIERQKRAFTAEKDLALRLAIRQSIALAQRRLEQRAQLEKSLRAATIRVDTLERATGALRGQALALGLTQELIAELDALRHEIGSEVSEEETIPRPFPAPSG